MRGRQPCNGFHHLVLARSQYFVDFGFKSHRASGGAVEARQQLKAAKKVK